MKSFLSICTVALCCAGIYACGSTGENASNASSSGRAVTASPIVAKLSGHLMGDHDDDDNAAESKTLGSNPRGDSDSDTDNDAADEARYGYMDSDDATWLAYGHHAGAADAQGITSVATRYYRAAAAADGATACALMYSTIAETVVEDHGSGAGPAYSRGTTCAAVMSKVFAHFHTQMNATYVITGIRIDHNLARVFLGSTTVPASYLQLHREHGAWRVAELIATSLP